MNLLQTIILLLLVLLSYSCQSAYTCIYQEGIYKYKYGNFTGCQIIGTKLGDHNES